MKQKHRQQVGRGFQRAVRNKRVQMALATLLVAILVNLMPRLVSIQSEILVLVSAIILALVGDYTVRDAAKIGQEQAKKEDTDKDGLWAESD